MGFFDFFKKKNKFDALTREDVVNAIIDLERQEKELEDGIERKENEIAALMEKGRTESSHDKKVFLAKKIGFLKQEKEADMQRVIYVMYNVSLLHKLKTTIDDNAFFNANQGCSINSLLADQKGLAAFLNRALNTRVRAEDVLTNADETFREIQGLYEPNSQIYGVSESEDALLAVFEDAQAADLGAANAGTAPAERRQNTDVTEG